MCQHTQRMSEPEGPKKPANATIQIDIADLAALETPPPPSGDLGPSMPPPLPPEEIARAQSLAPVQPAAASAQGAPPAKRGLGPYVLISIGVAAAAAGITTAVVMMNSKSAPAPVASAAASAAPLAPVDSASTAASAAGSAPVHTITLDTVEMGGAAGASSSK